MLEKRISTLSSNCLKVSIPVHKKFDEIESTLDSFLRLLRACSLYGVIDVDGKILPVTAYLSAYTFTKKFLKVIQRDIGAVITK